MDTSGSHRRLTMLITEEEFLNAVRSFTRTAFRFEARDFYALTYEHADLERFLAGSPVPPPELDWYRPWLDRVARWSREGKTISRVRVLAEPPTGYQRWMIWATPWHASVGEDIRYVRRVTARQVGLPMTDWWVLDEEKVIVMHFTADGETDGKELFTDPELVAGYCTWRDLAISNSVVAESIAA
jgi:hypothetical protein